MDIATSNIDTETCSAYPFIAPKGFNLAIFFEIPASATASTTSETSL